MTFERLDDEFQRAWKAGLVAERCERDLAVFRRLLLLGVLVVAGLIVAAAASPAPSMSRGDLQRRWVLMATIGLTFLLAWATGRRMPLRSHLAALAVFVAACSFIFLVWEPPSENRLQLYLWSLLLPGMPLLGGALTALKLRRARARCPASLREAWGHVGLARRDPANAVSCLERARDLLPDASPLASSIERAIEAARSGGLQEAPGVPGPSSTAPVPLVSVGLMLGGAIFVLTATDMGLPPAGADVVAIGGFAAAVTGLSRMLLRD